MRDECPALSLVAHAVNVIVLPEPRLIAGALGRAVLVAALVAIPVPAAWPGVAGRVDSVSGPVTAGEGTQARILHAADPVNEGDLLVTDANSWALLEMVDGATITLRPQTRLRVDRYMYAESQPSAGSSLLYLFQGAFRAVTGAIGLNNPRGYRISTPTATVGIRGTDHETAHYPPGMVDPGNEPGTYDKVNAGETVIRTAQGQEVHVKPGRVGFAHLRARTGPRLLASVPGFYRRHAQLDGRLVDRIKAIRERHERILRRRQQPRAEQGRARNVQEQASRRQHAREARREHRREHEREHRQ